MAWVQPAGCRVPPPRLACLAGLAAGWTGWGLVDWLGAGLPSQGLPGCCCPGAAAAGLLVCLAGLLAAAALGRLLLAGCLAGHLAGGARLLPWGGCCWGAWLAAAALGRLLLACWPACGCRLAGGGWVAVAVAGCCCPGAAAADLVACLRLRPGGCGCWLAGGGWGWWGCGSPGWPVSGCSPEATVAGWLALGGSPVSGCSPEATVAGWLAPGVPGPACRLPHACARDIPGR